jgi:hypothetical protein
MTVYTLYAIIEQATGRVVATGAADAGAITTTVLPEGQAILIDVPEEATGATHHYDYGVGGLVPRPPMPCVLDKTIILADGVDEAVVSGVPDSAYCQVRDQMADAEDGTLEFSSEVEGEFAVSITKFPYLDFVVVITAVAPP